MSDNIKAIRNARIVVALLSLCGLVLSLIALDQHVLYTHGFAAGPSFCHINEHFNCEAVNASPWSVFFGMPVAAYGLFFYGLVLLSTLVVSPEEKVLSPRAWSSLVLLLGAFATICSVALFAISELIIGSLCLMCIGMYLSNLLILVCAWRSAWVGRFWFGIKSGVVELFNLVGVVIGVWRTKSHIVPWRVRVVALIVVALALFSIISPQLVYRHYASKKVHGPDYVMEWRNYPQVQFDLRLGGGAFDDYYHGDPEAPIQIVEFADYECPACKQMHKVLDDVLNDFQGRYLFVFRNYPLDQACNPYLKRKLHEFACVAVAFSRCAGEQGRFWQANEILFLRNSENGELSKQNLIVDGSRELGIDSDAVAECIESGRYADTIKRDLDAGMKAGLMGTPSIWINGRLVPQPSEQSLRAILQSVLRESAHK